MRKLVYAYINSNGEGFYITSLFIETNKDIIEIIKCKDYIEAKEKLKIIKEGSDEKN